MKTEQKIQSEIISYLKSINAYSVKTLVTNSNGTPDILCCIKGRFVGIEVKKEDGVVSKLQDYHLKSIYEAGGLGFVARSVEDVKKHIRHSKER